MKYPKFLNNNSTIGIVALSAGVGEDIEEFNKSINNINKNYKTIETKSVRNIGEVSNTAEERSKELDELVLNNNIDLIMCAAGGDFLIEILPFVNYDNIKNNPKWIMGASDPTSLLYTVTTKLDIATIYGHNAGSFDSKRLYKSQKVALDFLSGKIIKQEKYNKYEKNRDGRIDGNYNLEEKVIWKKLNGNLDITGRIIGGCIDCLRDLPGTRFDNTKEFIEKYKKDGIIWYLDIFSLSTEDFYRTLIQLKESGWFKYTVGVIVGRVMFPKNYTSMTYENALLKIFNNIPILFNVDIGHVAPKMTIINGAIAHVVCNEKEAYIEQFLK